MSENRDLPDNTSRPTQGLLLRASGPDATGLVCAIDPASSGWEYTTFHAYRLAPGSSVERPADHQERLVLILEGRARVRTGDLDLGVVGSRSTVFDGPPCPVLLVEPGRAVAIISETTALVAVAAAPGGPVSRTALIAPEEILVESRGSGSTARRIHHLLPPSAEAGRLMPSSWAAAATEPVLM